VPDFAHPSERDVASLLGSYGIRWEYEPTTFVLSSDEHGNPTSAFTPDFHLPDFDLYLEVTTVRQPHVTRKHRKIRMLAEMHPDVRVVLLNRRDIERLSAKYGLADAA
jgi:hypoxanthine phosphoribosyltransferase